MKLNRALGWIMLALTGFALDCQAADPATEAMQQAYGPYRVVLLRTNTKAQAESEQAIVQARQAWRAVVARFTAEPPVPYAGDSTFKATLDEVGQIYERAAAEIADQKLAQAHVTLEHVRDLLAGLRQRNGVVVYSDHVNAYHEEMEWVLQHGPALTESQEQGAMRLMERVGALVYLTQRLRSEASADLLAQREFVAALQAVESSVAALRGAVLAQDGAAMRAALGGLKKPYSQFFVKFG